MRTQQFIVTLEDEVIISRRAATLGGQYSLDYLPGAVFLGVAAARLYAALGQEQAYTAFHSGQVRFSNALLLGPDKQPVYPLPLSWHTLNKEYAQEIEDGVAALEADRICNKLFTGAGAKQLESGYFSLDGCYYRPRPELRMKTAIDSRTGRAKDRQLFGYAGLPTGLRFSFCLSADAAAEDLLEKIADSLTGPQRLGRSRSAEYGRARIEAAGEVPARVPGEAILKNTVVIWLLSDTALLDDRGQPTLTPRAEHFGLPPESKLDLKHTFTHDRRYTPFNAKYRKREQERVVLRMGSVLSFRVADGFDAVALGEKLADGVGLYRQAGLGQVWVNPPVLKGEQPEFQPTTDSPQFTEKRIAAVPAPNTPLALWLRATQAQTQSARQAEEIADAWARKIRTLYASARQLAGVPAGVCVGPSPSQWGRVMEAAKMPGLSADELQRRLFEGVGAVCKEEKNPDWSVKVWPQGCEQLPFRAWLQARCAEIEPSLLPAALALAARQAMDIARAEEGETRHAG